MIGFHGRFEEWRIPSDRERRRIRLRTPTGMQTHPTRRAVDVFRRLS